MESKNKQTFTELLKKFYNKLGQIRGKRLNLLKKIDQQNSDKDIKNIEEKIKNL